MEELEGASGDGSGTRAASASACCCCGSAVFIGRGDGSVAARWGDGDDERSNVLVEARGGDGGDDGVARMFATEGTPSSSSEQGSLVAVLTVVSRRGLIDVYRVDLPRGGAEPRVAPLSRRLSVAPGGGGADPRPVVEPVDAAYHAGTLFVAASGALFAARGVDRDEDGSMGGGLREVWRLRGAEGDPEEFVQLHVSGRGPSGDGAHLLVSTTARAMVAPMERVAASVARGAVGLGELFVQIGTKPRRGRYGSCFHPQVSALLADGDQGAGSAPPSSCWGFSARPGRRLWIFNGTKVEATVRLPPSVGKDITPLLFPLADHLVLIAESPKGGVTIAALSIADTETIAVLPERHCVAMRGGIRGRVAVADAHVTLVTADGAVLRWTRARGRDEGGLAPSAFADEGGNANGDGVARAAVPDAAGAAPEAPRSPADSATKRESIFNTAGDWEEAVVKVDDSLRKGVHTKTAMSAARRKRTPVTVNLDSGDAPSGGGGASMRKSLSVDAMMSSLRSGGSPPSAAVPAHAPGGEGALECWRAYAQPDAAAFAGEAMRVLERDAATAAASDAVPGSCVALFQAALAAHQAALGARGDALDAALVSGLLLPLLRWQYAYIQNEGRRRSTSTMLSSLNLEESAGRAEDERRLWTTSFELQISVDGFVGAAGATDPLASPLLREWDDRRAMEFLRDHWNHLDVDRVQDVSRAMGWHSTEAAATAFSFSAPAPVDNAHPSSSSVGATSEVGGEPGAATAGAEAARDAPPLLADGGTDADDPPAADGSARTHGGSGAGAAAATDGGGTDDGRGSLLAYARRRLEEVGPRAAIGDLLSAASAGDADAAAAFHLLAGARRGPAVARDAGGTAAPCDLRCVPSDLLELLEGEGGDEGAGARAPERTSAGGPWGVLVSVNRTDCACCGLPLSLAGVETKIVVSRAGQAYHYGCMSLA